MTDLLLAFGYCALSAASAAAIVIGSWFIGVVALAGSLLLTIEILRSARGR